MRSGAHDTGAVLRKGVVVLVYLSIAATAVDLALLRHWDSAVQLVPWAALAASAVAGSLVAWRPTRGKLIGARALGAGLLFVAAFGVAEHVMSNYRAAPLDAVYGARWDALSETDRWWAAATGAVGPSPTLAPAVLAETDLLILLATLAHPALDCGGQPRRRRSEPSPAAAVRPPDARDGWLMRDSRQSAAAGGRAPGDRVELRRTG